MIQRHRSEISLISLLFLALLAAGSLVAAGGDRGAQALSAALPGHAPPAGLVLPPAEPAAASTPAPGWADAPAFSFDQARNEPLRTLPFAGPWTQIGETGGATVHALALHPSTPGRILAGTYFEGLFLTTDGGGSWSNPLQAGVGAIAINRQVPSTVYAGCWDVGVYKSSDGGASWSPRNTGLAANDVLALAIDPSAPNTLYAGTEMGIFKSVDGAAHWQGASNGFSGHSVYAFAFSGGELLAGSDRGVFVSSNGGGSWTPSGSGLTANEVLTLVSDGATVYAGTDNGVYRSDDGGASWTAARGGLPVGKVYTLAIVPGSPQIVLAGTRQGVYASLDGGSSWGSLNEGLSDWALRVYALALDGAGTASHLYAGTGGGVWQRSAEVEPTPTPTITPTPRPGKIYLPLMLRVFPPPTPTPTPGGGWQTIFSDGFEGSFPGPWQLFGEPTWGRTDCRTFAGSRSVWPAATGPGAVTPCVDNYPNNLFSWLYYGPFDLSDASAAEVTFQRWQLTEPGYDYFQWMVSLDDVSYSGRQSSGDTEGWVTTTIDLSNVNDLGNVLGQPQVWVAFILESDSSINFSGVFVDNVVVRKKTGGVLSEVGGQGRAQSTPTLGSWDLLPASARRP